MKKIIVAQFVILLIGTVFAWVNFGIELVNWLNSRACQTDCAAGLTSPFLTPCFFGAIFFTVAFILDAAILRNSQKV